jgi:Histidine kinase-, DNA gyrase B-, and HSP90-like ATPase
MTKTATHKLQAGDQTYMIRKLGEALPEWMQYREAIWNSIEAIARTGQPGKITVAPWGNGKVRIVDTGDGMTRPQMLKVLNTTFTSGTSTVGEGKNHGIGSKITLRVQNPFGVEYITFRDGVATAVRFVLDAKHGYTIDAANADGADGARTASTDELDPAIVAAGHGTQVTMYGHGANDKPAKLIKSAYDAMSERLWERDRNLETCSFTFADGTTSELYGTLDRMCETAEDMGHVEMVDADGGHLTNAWWFTFPAGAEHGRTAGLLSGVEIYSPKRGQTAKTMLADCGIHEGSHRVAVFFEPSFEAFPPNTERNALVPAKSRAKSIDTHIGRWSAAFKQALPQQILDVIEEETANAAQAATTFDRSQFPSAWKALYRLPSTKAVRHATGRTAAQTPSSIVRSSESRTSSPAGTNDPNIGWLNGDQGADLYSGRPAVYDPTSHTIWLDPTHERFVTVTKFFTEMYVDVPSAANVIDRIVRERFITVAVDLFYSVAADATVKQAEAGFNAAIKHVLGMLSTNIMPSIGSSLKTAFR